MGKIDIEYYENGDDILLIITGIGGTTKGFDNKYERIARNIMKNYKFSIVVATSPTGSWLNTKENLDYVMNYIFDIRKNNNFKIYAIGNSAGANIVLWHSNKFSQIKKILAINPVMNINIHRFKQLKDMQKEISIVFGELDNSSRYAELLPSGNNIKVEILPKIDHNFTGNLEQFINLPNVYLFQ